MIDREHADAILRRAGEAADDDIDLAETALALASYDRPHVPLERYRDHLKSLVSEVGTATTAREGRTPNLDARVDALNDVLFARYGYRGDTLTYDDLQNANLMRVIDRRKGLPVTLGILCLSTAAGLGWRMFGLRFPGHFILRAELDGARVIIDPFHGGKRRQTGELREILKATAGSAAEIEPAFFRRVGNREILLRLQNNIKTRLIQRQHFEAAAAVVERMLLFAPGFPALWRDAGLMRAQSGNLRDAVTALEQAIVTETSDTVRHQTALLLQELRNRIN